MDFLKIRRKAKERAARAAKAATPSPTPSAATATATATATPPAPPAPARQAEAAPVTVPGGRTALDAAPGAASPAAVLPEPTNLPAPAGPPRPVRHPHGSPEAQRREAELGTRIAALPPSSDSRFVTWRPDGGGLPELAAIRPAGEERPAPEAGPDRPLAPLAPLDDFFYREDEAAPQPGLVAPSVTGGALLAPLALDEYLTFRLAGETYGVEIGRVVEVLRTPPITEVPRAPSDVRGIISVRGDVVTVLDPRGRLGLARAEGPPARRMVVVEDGEGSCGLLVDRVAGVVRLPRGALEPCPQALGSAGGDLFLGIGRERDRLFVVLDVKALLRPLRRTAEARAG